MGRASKLSCALSLCELSTRTAWFALVLAGLTVQSAVAAEAYTLSEPSSEKRAYQVTAELTVKGQLETATGKGNATALKLEVAATHQYLERRLSGAGRDAEALRFVRAYDKAEARIQAGDNIASSQLRKQRRLIVAQGRREGITFYNQKGAMSNSELELLEMPGDSLSALGLLPTKPVNVGDSWKVDGWVLQMLTGTEAVIKSELTCKLGSVDEQQALVTFEGSIEGATLGAANEITISGHYMFDLEGRYLKQLELKQKEKRSVGAVSPGMNVEAELSLARSPSQDIGDLTDAVTEDIPLTPPADALLVELRLPWGVRIVHNRDWHVFHTTKSAAVLRMLDKGSLVAQCNVTQVDAMQPGEHTPDVRFQDDIRTALADKLSEIVQAEQLKVDAGHYRYRVTALGKSNGLDMRWIYYLCADPSGRQTALVFAFEVGKAEKIARHDLEMVRSLEFFDAGRPVTSKE